ncbi:MAG: HlyD family secretion protein [gamma proteobacterium symbiont of Taylorina sp.]|nr:HlyD family secretion protein [gamma proteobacterium symbiont of Taylorina sp.]
MDTNRKRKIVSILLLLISIIAVLTAYYRYVSTPWTRHGEVQADIIKVAPRISGMVNKIMIKDNQAVKQDDVLFIIDPEPFQLEVEKAKVGLKQTQLEIKQLRASVIVARKELLQATENLQYNRKNAARIEKLRTSDSISQDMADRSRKSLAVAVAEEKRAEANLLKAEAALGDQKEEHVLIQAARIKLRFAELDLSYTQVKSVVDGYVVKVNIAAGDYGKKGIPLVAVVDENSLRISAMFRENQLHNIAVGDTVEVVLMSAPGEKLHGQVSSLGTAIAPPETIQANALIPSIPAIFDWIRLPQRVPVNIKLETGQNTAHMIPGMTASVTVRR